MSKINMREMLEAGVHFGHQTKRWNPKMRPYIYGARNGIYIINLSKTVHMFDKAYQFVSDLVAKGETVMFVGTKKQAQDIVKEEAMRADQFFITHRWLGGTLTNWSTVSNSIKQLRELNAMFESGGGSGLTKKELLDLERRREKLQKSLGGIADMGGLPSAMIVIDTNKEAIAVQEARKLGIPVVAVLDTNCDPADADYGFPGNDDAARAISLYCNLFADAVLDGLAESSAGLGMDLGELEDVTGVVEADVAAADQTADETGA